jgi:hypothetical protein
MTKTYLVVMADGKQLEIVAQHRTHALLTAMELCNTKDVPVRATQLTDW